MLKFQDKKDINIQQIIYSELRDIISSLSKRIDDIDEKLEKLLTADKDPLWKEKCAREIEVQNINAVAGQRMQSARNRDAYFTRKIAIKNTDASPLTAEELAEINSFWEPYSFAYQNDPTTQWALSRISGKFDPSYIGFGLQRWSMVRFWNSPIFEYASFKNMLPKFFPMAKQAKVYFNVMGGGCTNENDERISFNEGIEHCYNILSSGEKLIVKMGLGKEGKSITLLESGTSKEELTKVLREYGDDFSCQQVIVNHPSFREMHPQSLNTLRISTLLYKNKVHWVGTVLRMGCGDSVVDNWSAGGVACSVDENGVCGDFACSETGEVFFEHPTTGIKFAGHTLYNYRAAQELAIRLHRSLPQQKYIAWDITIDKAGDPVLIECNSPGSSEIMQAVGYNAYLNKDIAKEILDEYLIRRFFYRKANFDWDYREFSDHISLVKYCGFDSVIHVPSHIEGKAVTLVYAGAISKPNVVQVHVPQNVSCQGIIIKGCAPNCKIIND